MDACLAVAHPPALLESDDLHAASYFFPPVIPRLYPTLAPLARDTGVVAWQRAATCGGRGVQTSNPASAAAPVVRFESAT